MKNELILKIRSDSNDCMDCPNTYCVLLHGDTFICDGQINPSDLNEILGYGARWNCDLAVSELTAVTIASYFAMVTHPQTGNGCSETWSNFHLKTRLIHGYNALAGAMDGKLPKRLRIFGKSIFQEDSELAALHPSSRSG